MKQGIHPDYHDIKVVMTDGTEFITRSCYGAKDATLNLDIDTLHHLIGGWRTSQGQFHDLLRPLAWAMPIGSTVNSAPAT